MKEEKLIKIINLMIENSEPIYYKDFNKFYKTKNKEELYKLEKQYNELGIATFKTILKNKNWIYDKNIIGISILSIIATITDVLISKRLSFCIEDNGRISGVQFYKED